MALIQEVFNSEYHTEPKNGVKNIFIPLDVVKRMGRSFFNSVKYNLKDEGVPLQYVLRCLNSKRVMLVFMNEIFPEIDLEYRNRLVFLAFVDYLRQTLKDSQENRTVRSEFNYLYYRGLDQDVCTLIVEVEQLYHRCLPHQNFSRLKNRIPALLYSFLAVITCEKEMPYVNVVDPYYIREFAHCLEVAHKNYNLYH